MGLVSVPQTIPIPDQLGLQMLLMAYSPKCLVFSPLVNGKQNTLKFSEKKKKLLLFVMDRQEATQDFPIQKKNMGLSDQD